MLHQEEKRQNTSTKEGNNTGNQAKTVKKYHGGKVGGDPKKPRDIHPQMRTFPFYTAYVIIGDVPRKP